MLCYSIIKYNSTEREYKDYFIKALHLSTLAQSTGHPCLMYLIRFMTMYDCFCTVKTNCTVHCNLVLSHCNAHKTSTFTPTALCYHSVAYMYPWICLKSFTPNTLPMYFLCCSVKLIISAYFKWMFHIIIYFSLKGYI